MNYIKITDDKSVKTSELYRKVKDKFSTWSYCNEEELDTQFPKPKKTTTRYFKDVQEADEEHKNKSANDLEKEGIEGITLRERLIFEIEYFNRHDEHPDVDNMTLCSGSRFSDGRVPRVGWDVGDRKVCVGWCSPSGSNSGLRARASFDKPSDLNLVPSCDSVALARGYLDAAEHAITKARKLME